MGKTTVDLDLDDLDLDPNAVYRVSKWGKPLFGYEHTQLDEKIASGEVPEPFLLSEGGRARGWTGRQIIKHHRKRIAATLKLQRGVKK